MTARHAGDARITEVVIDTRTRSINEVQLTADVSWADDRGGSMEVTFSGLSPDDQIETGLRVGLLGDPLPPQLDRSLGFMIDTSDPLAGLDGLMLPPSAEEAVGRLLVVERLIGGGRTSRLVRFSLGPPHLGERRIELKYVEPRRYANHEPNVRQVEGV